VFQQHVTAEVPELPLAVTAGLDPRIAAVVRRLLAKAPESRFADATELLGAIDGCTTALGVPAIARPLAQAARRPSSPPWLHRIMARAAPVLRNASPRRIFVAAFLAATVVIGLVVVVVWPRATTSAAAPSATASSVMPVDSAELPARTGESSPVTTLPPPPAPSATTAGSKPASSQTPSRKTGPGGIYVPPPSQWFR
jgi:hypothetical protein